ncbi:MAG TPA: CpXC domain-containing protein [Nitrospirota bacterium]
MFNLLAKQAEAYSRETFECGSCNRDFEAGIITWVDVSRTPQARHALLKWEFNIVQCTHCGCRHFAGTPFFYEDFEEGFLIAVFPSIPERRGEGERALKAKYGYYPILEFFYDMAQIWMLIYFQEHYKVNKNLRSLSRLGRGEERIRKMLRFLKEDPLMINIREKLTETFVGGATQDELVDLLGQAVYKLEGMLPWPRDRRCVCGEDLANDFNCCGRKVNLSEHESLLSRHYAIYCPSCNGALTGASCEHCGRVYTWKLGTASSYRQPEEARYMAEQPKSADFR